jgi:type I restriction enzyme S subunit
MSETLNSPEAKGRRFRPYPKYKDSGVEWLGEIPAHWEAKRLKLASFINMGQSPSSDIVNTSGEGLPFLQGNADFGAEHPTAQTFCPAPPKIAEFGDVLLSVRAPVGALNLADQKYGIGRGLCAIRPNIQILERTFCHYSLQIARHELHGLAKGSTYDAVSMSEVSCLLIPLPSIKEQCTIASFLDHETAKIDALIEKKERLIELLREKRTALITQAVTKGLDPNVPMKDSGVEWLGKIAADWKCLALSRVCLARCDGPFGSGLKSEHYSESGVRVVRLQNIGSAEFFDTDRAYINEEYRSQLGDHSVFPGDLLIAGLGDDAHPVGRACVAPENIAPAIVKADCFRFRLDVRLLLPRFGAYQLSVTAAAAAGAFSTGATRSRLNLTAMATRKVALPPLEEQAAIVIILDQRCDESCAVIAKIKEAIDRLKEYRTALISAAVTGKIDVRQEA